jgi:hypothetical protein
MVRIVVSNATFNNISAILWPSVSLVKTADLSQVTGNIFHIMLYRVFELTTSVVISSDCIGNYKDNSHTIRTMATPIRSGPWRLPCSFARHSQLATGEKIDLHIHFCLYRPTLYMLQTNRQNYIEKNSCIGYNNWKATNNY